ncbi:MAG: hypothetical protein V1888_00560 [archaeon]
MKRKLRVGVFSFTCCEGCCISVIESLNSRLEGWRDVVEFVNFRALKKVRKIGAMDVAFVEGAVSTADERMKLAEIRENAKVVVALGSGAINGWPSNLRNGFEGEKKERVMKLVRSLDQLEKIVPIKEVISVDDEIAGCPVSEEDFAERLESLILAKGLLLKKKKKKVVTKKKKVVARKKKVVKIKRKKYE